MITYSGSATDENYAMGMIWADEKSDLLDDYLWYKSKEPILHRLKRIVCMVLVIIHLLYPKTVRKMY